MNLDTELEVIPGFRVQHHFLLGPRLFRLLISHPSFGVWKTAEKITFFFPGSIGWNRSTLLQRNNWGREIAFLEHCFYFRKQ